MSKKGKKKALNRMLRDYTRGSLTVQSSEREHREGVVIYERQAQPFEYEVRNLETNKQQFRILPHGAEFYCEQCKSMHLVWLHDIDSTLHLMRTFHIPLLNMLCVDRSLQLAPPNVHIEGERIAHLFTIDCKHGKILWATRGENGLDHEP